MSVLLPALNEEQKRLLIGAEALALGRGGITHLSKITGMNRHTVAKGVREYESGNVEVTRIRNKGAGHRELTTPYPQIKQSIEQIIEQDSRGDPESPLRWTCKSVRNIADFLADDEYDVSHTSVARILHDMEYSLQAKRKTKEGEDHPDRDQQFRLIRITCKRYLSRSELVISVDAKTLP